jgi:hypothetical protein
MQRKEKTEKIRIEKKKNGLKTQNCGDMKIKRIRCKYQYIARCQKSVIAGGGEVNFLIK